jgi:hypothetical protein
METGDVGRDTAGQCGPYRSGVPTSLAARLAVALLAALAILGLGMLAVTGDDPRVRDIKVTEVAAQTGVQLPDHAYDVRARATVRGQRWMAVAFRIDPGHYGEALSANHIGDLQAGLTVLRNGDDLGLRWFPRNAKRLAGTTDRLPDGRVRRIQIMWGKTLHKGQPPNPQVCITIAPQ